jgi:PEP-CTERM motif
LVRLDLTKFAVYVHELVGNGKNHTLVRVGNLPGFGQDGANQTPELTKTMKIISSAVPVLAILGLAIVSASAQTSYTVSLTGGGTWNTVFAQGFSTSLGATPAPGAANGDTVNLTQFQFFKSGNADTAANFQLAIFNTLFPNTTGLTTANSAFVGLSANVVASTSALAVGAPITFTFNNLPLTFGNDYSAYFVNVSGNSLTPVLVSALTADYAATPPGSTTFVPVQQYGTTSQFQYATGSTINSGFLSDFSDAGDAMFTASITTVPEPSTYALMGLGAAMIIGRVVRRKLK